MRFLGQVFGTGLGRETEGKAVGVEGVANKYPPAYASGISLLGIGLNTTGGVQMRFRLACQPCNCYVHPLERD